MEITNANKVWKCDLNNRKFYEFLFLMSSRIITGLKAISNTRKSVSSYFQKPRVCYIT